MCFLPDDLVIGISDASGAVQRELVTNLVACLPSGFLDDRRLGDFS